MVIYSWLVKTEFDAEIAMLISKDIFILQFHEIVHVILILIFLLALTRSLIL